MAFASVHPISVVTAQPSRLGGTATTSGSTPLLRHRTHYSPSKFIALHSYITSASIWRVVAVLLLTPAPAFIASVLPSLIPVRSPLIPFNGADTIATALVLCHNFCLVFYVSFGTILLTLGATSTPRHVYSECRAAFVAALVALFFVAYWFMLFHYWRFPVPFVVLLNAPVWIFALIISHAVTLRRVFQRHPHLIDSLRRYDIPLAIQTGQFGLYAGLTVIFTRVGTMYQILMVVIFPLIKFGLKRLMRKYSERLEEMSVEVAVSTVEISASLYQSMIMQTTPSTLALYVIMGIDLIQGLVAVKFFMARYSTTPHREIFPRAIEIIQRCHASLLDTRERSALEVYATKHEAVVVREALELASATDTVLLIEYFEVSVPIVNALFLLVTYHSSTTRYNTRLYTFYQNSDLVRHSTLSVLLYSLLQGLSCVAMYLVLRRRHNISAFYHLAFVLEFHARAIQGKLLVFFTLVFCFTLLHYGADFTLRFDFNELLKEMTLTAT